MSSISNTADRKDILVISLSKYLSGHPISDVIAADWAKTDDATRARFNNVGFQVDPTDTPKMLDELRNTVKDNHWDGLLVGWCSRGNPERTELFEEIVNVCIEAKAPKTKLIFNTGPKNLVEPAVRSFP